VTGRDDAEIRSAEQRLGITLPQALRDGYRLCGRREYHLYAPDVYVRHRDRLLAPEELRLDAERAALVYRFNGEYPMEWAARLTGEPDRRWSIGRPRARRDGRPSCPASRPRRNHPVVRRAGRDPARRRRHLALGVLPHRGRRARAVRRNARRLAQAQALNLRAGITDFPGAPGAQEAVYEVGSATHEFSGRATEQ
jgi:hypothetical protein